jgi:heat shock protein HslJ
MTMARALVWMCAAAMTACAAPSNSGGATPPPSPGPQAAPGKAPAGSLVGTRWMGLIDASIDKRATPWLEFVGEGRVSGFTGCNLLNGAWRNEGGQVRIGPLITTKRGCAGPEGDIERRVLAALNDQSRVTREGNKLVFVGAGGERFEFVEAK